uniref:Uncharacterized protein n=1 Tax=Globisporangium ultimum (strain ATCC 200006 / CBS 805.95 / DAOM BR144) TaxID=431595 RepID=K3WM49_GLOUD
VDCNQPSNIPDSIDDNDGFLVNPQGLTYVGTVLHLKTTKNSATDFNFMVIEAGSLPIFTMNGIGDTELLEGNMRISSGYLQVQEGVTIVTLGLNVQNGGATITSTDSQQTNTDIVSTHSAFGGTTLRVRANRGASSLFMLFEAMTAGTAPVVDIRGDGLTTIRTGGLSIVTGGATIADNQLNVPTLTVKSNSLAYTGSLLKLDTSRVTQYPALDYILIDAQANGIPAFSVEASGKTTIYDGGMIARSSGIASETLVVKATSNLFASDVVSIQSVSTVNHILLKASVVGGAGVLFQIQNTGLTTITQGGLMVTAGGATVNAGGLRVTTG